MASTMSSAAAKPPVRPSFPGKPPPFRGVGGARVWVTVLGLALALNMTITVLLCLARASTSAAASVETVAPPNVEILARIREVEVELGKFRTEVARQQELVTRLQAVCDALQEQVARIPPPIVPAHGVAPVVEQPAATKQP